MSRLGVGIVGAGFIGERHGRILAAQPDVRIVGIADANLARARALASTVNAQPFTDWRELFEHPSLEAVWLCLPPFAHGAPELALVERQIPFLVEKPLAVDAATAETVARAVAESGLKTAVGYHWRWLDTVDALRRRLQLRPAHLLSGYWLDFTPPPAWWSLQQRSGGQFVEQTTHIFDLARYLAGEVESVYAVGARAPREAHPDCDIDEVSAATLVFRSGAIGSMLSTCLLHRPHRVGLHLFGDGFAAELHEDEMTLIEGDRRWTRQADADPFVAEDRAFVDAVAGQANRIRSDYADALLTHRLTQAALASRRCGCAVAVGDHTLAESSNA